MKGERGPRFRESVVSSSLRAFETFLAALDTLLPDTPGPRRVSVAIVPAGHVVSFTSYTFRRNFLRGRITNDRRHLQSAKGFRVLSVGLIRRDYSTVYLRGSILLDRCSAPFRSFL